MDRRSNRRRPGRPVRQAHPRRRLPSSLPALALAWAALLAAVSMGTVLGGGGAGAPTAASFQPVVVSDAAGGPAAGGPASGGPAAGGPASTDSARQAGGGAFGSVAGEAVTLACAPRGEPQVATAASPAEAASPPQAAPAPATQPIAAFLGDSYTTGYNGFGLGAAGWPAIVSAALGLEPINRAVAGTGFVNPGWTGQPIKTRLDAVIKANPRVVFLAGGHNDRRYGAAAAMDAAVPVIDRLHAALPNATLVIVGPIWQSGSVPAALRSLDDQLRQKAASIGATFIDPVRGGWFAGPWQQLISGDGIHPTNAGHRRIADLVLAALAGSPAVPPKLAPAAAPPVLPAPVPARDAGMPCPA